MYPEIDPDALTDDAMLDLVHGIGGNHPMTNAWGQDTVTLPGHDWLMDLISADGHLKELSKTRHVLDGDQLIQPDAFGSEWVRLAPDPVLETLTTVYAVLVALFQETEIGQHYRPSPYADRFLRAFASCAYLHEAAFHCPPTMCRDDAEQVVVEINQRLGAWYLALSQPDFTYECRRNQRNSQHNYKRLWHVINTLFSRYSCLQVVRLDLAYSKMDGPGIDYDTARHHRENLCQRFHGRDDLFKHLVGYSWKLEWRPKKGFHYHWLFFFDGHQIREDIRLAKLIGELWSRSITGCQGVYYNCNSRPNSYKHSAVGKVWYHDHTKKKGLDNIARYHTKVDDYAVMAVQGRIFQSSAVSQLSGGPSLGRPRESESAFSSLPF